MRIRQLALVAKELDPVVEDLRAVFGVVVCHNDPGVAEFGLHNALMPFNNRFLEVVSPIQEGTTCGRLLDKRGGDGGYMVIVQVEDHERERERIDELGVRVVWEISLPMASTFHLHPKDTGGALLSFDVATPPESWYWAGPWEDKVRTEVVKDFAGIELQSADPKALASRWGQILDRPVEAQGDSGYGIELGGDTLRFVPDADGRGEGLSGILVAVADRERVLSAAKDRNLPTTEDSVSICGTVFRLVG